MNRITQILSLVDAYRNARGISESRVSTLVFNDGKRLASLRAGADLGTRTADAAVLWFSSNWPDNAEWPLDVERPSQSAGAGAAA